MNIYMNVNPWLHRYTVDVEVITEFIAYDNK